MGSEGSEGVGDRIGFGVWIWLGFSLVFSGLVCLGLGLMVSGRLHSEVVFWGCWSSKKKRVHQFHITFIDSQIEKKNPQTQKDMHTHVLEYSLICAQNYPALPPIVHLDKPFRV